MHVVSITLFDSPISRIKLVPIGHHAGLAVVEEGAQVDAIVPVVGEVLDLAVGQHRLQTEIIACKICLKSPCTSISASNAVLAVQGLLRHILQIENIATGWPITSRPGLG